MHILTQWSRLRSRHYCDCPWKRWCEKKYLEVKCRMHLRVETGRARRLPLMSRICENCYNGEVEDEFHFVMVCSIFNTERNEMLHANRSATFDSMSCLEKFIYLCSQNSPSFKLCNQRQKHFLLHLLQEIYLQKIWIKRQTFQLKLSWITVNLARWYSSVILFVFYVTDIITLGNKPTGWVLYIQHRIIINYWT